MDELSIQEAANLARTMKKKLQAFEKIEEVVAAAANARVVMDRHTDELKRVQAEIGRGQAQLAALKDQVIEAQEDLSKTLTAVGTKTKEELDKQASLLEAKRDSMQKEISLLHIQRKSEEERLEATREVAREEIDELEAEIETLKQNLTDLRESAAQLAGL